jgi:tetratricopeptide (TPR) repeat protein
VVWQQLGDVLRELGEREEAVGVYRRALEIEPDFLKVQEKLANVLTKVRANFSIEAELDKDEYMEPLFQENQEITETLDNSLLNEENLDAAINNYSIKIRSNPNISHYHTYLGDALKQRARSDLNRAMNCYRQGIVLNPNILDNYHKALEIKSDDAELYLKLANVLVRKNDYEQGIVFYRIALQIQPNNDRAHFFLGKALEKQNNFTEAIASFERAFKINPDQTYKNTLINLSKGKN